MILVPILVSLDPLEGLLLVQSHLVIVVLGLIAPTSWFADRVVRGAMGRVEVAEWHVVVGVALGCVTLFFGVVATWMGFWGGWLWAGLLGWAGVVVGVLPLVFRHPAWERAA